MRSAESTLTRVLWKTSTGSAYSILTSPPMASPTSSAIRCASCRGRAEGQALLADALELQAELLGLALGAVRADARLERGQHHQQHRQARREAHGEERRHQPPLQAEGAPGPHGALPSSPPKA